MAAWLITLSATAYWRVRPLRKCNPKHLVIWDSHAFHPWLSYRLYHVVSNKQVFGQMEPHLSDLNGLDLQEDKVGNPRHTGSARLFLDMTLAVTLAVTSLQ